MKENVDQAVHKTVYTELIKTKQVVCTRIYLRSLSNPKERNIDEPNPYILESTRKHQHDC